MNKIPCECMIWKGLPTIKKEITKCIIDQFGKNQREAARLMGMTPAAVCQYMSNKRARIKINDKKIRIEINISAERIIENGSSSVVPEICRICQIIKSNVKYYFLFE